MRLPAALLPALLAGASLPGAALAFDLDLSVPELLALSHGPTFATVAAGNGAPVHTDYLCHRRGGLFLYAHAPVEAQDDLHWEATPAADGSVALTGRDGRRAATTAEVLFEIETVLLWQHCEDAVLTSDPRDLMPVTSVNGSRSLSALHGEAR